MNSIYWNIKVTNVTYPVHQLHYPIIFTQMTIINNPKRSQKCFTLVQSAELLVQDPDHVGGGGAPARVGEGLLGAAPGEPGRAPGSQDLRSRGRTGVSCHGGPVQEGGQGAGQHVSLTSASPGRASC